MGDILDIIIPIIFICIVIGVVKYLFTTYRAVRIVVGIILIIIGFILIPTIIARPIGKYIAMAGGKLIDNEL